MYRVPGAGITCSVLRVHGTGLIRYFRKIQLVVPGKSCGHLGLDFHGSEVLYQVQHKNVNQDVAMTSIKPFRDGTPVHIDQNREGCDITNRLLPSFMGSCAGKQSPNVSVTRQNRHIILNKHAQ